MICVPVPTFRICSPEAINTLFFITDYKKILIAMKAVGWKYADKNFDQEGDIPTHTPTIPELRDCATMVSTDAVAYLETHPGKPGFAGCGGFEAEADYDEKGELWLSLKFVLNDNCP